MGRCYGEINNGPLGVISLIAGDEGLCQLAFSSLKKLKARLGDTFEEPSLVGLETIGILLSEVNEYLFGLRKTFSAKIDWSGMTTFQRSVLELTSRIPYGEFRTYGTLAQQLGKPGAARAVGKALAENPMPIVIPCHRVVDSTHHLRGFAAPDGIQTKAFLLQLEGLQIQGDRIVVNQEGLFQA